MKDFTVWLEALAQKDLGSILLTIVLYIGFFLMIVTIIRSIEIPIRIAIDKRKASKITKEISEAEIPDQKGFES